VKYAYIVSGGVQNPTSFSNYIPIGYLREALNLKEAIDNFDFNNQIGEHQQRFKEQYFQHNPKKAKVLDRDNVGSIRTRGKLKTKIRTRDNEPFYNMVYKGGEQVPEPIPFVSVYDTKSNKWRLYQYHNDGNHYEIDTLGKANEGGYNTVEYNLSKDKRMRSSVIEDNHTKHEGNPFIEGKGQPDGPNHETRSMKTLLDEEVRIDAEDFYQSVRDNSDDSYTSEISKLLEEIDKDFKIIVRPQRRFGNSTTDGRYNRNKYPEDTLFISEGMLDKEGRNNHDYITRTVIHELLHKQVREIANKNRNELTDVQEDALENIERLMKKSVNKNPPTNKVKSLLQRNGEYSIDEFISAVIANKPVQEWAAETEIDSGESLLDRFITNVMDLIKGLAENIGIEIDSRSSLAYTIENVIRLIDDQKKVKENVPSNPKNKSKSDQVSSDEAEESDLVKNLSEPEGLTDDQQTVFTNAVEYTENGDPSNPYVIQGKAGTGKTFTIGEILSEIEGDKMIAVSTLSHKALNVLRKSVPDSVRKETIASLLGKRLNLKTGEFTDEGSNDADKYDLIIIDEASMINQKTHDLIMENKRDDAKIIYVGDPGQLPPVEGDESVVFNFDNKDLLTERIRQGEGNPILDISDNYWMADQIPNIDRVNEDNQLGKVTFETEESGIKRLISKYRQAIDSENPNIVKAVAYRNNKREEINNRVRNAIFGDTDVDYHEGEIITMSNNSLEGFIHNGEDATVVEHLGTNEMAMNLSGYSSDQRLRSTMSKMEEEIDGKLYIHRLRMKRSRDGKEEVITVPTVETRKKIENTLTSVAKRNGGVYWAAYYDMIGKIPDIDYGYAVTSHKVQGSTYETSMIFEDDIRSVRPISGKEKAQSIYTAITRASDEAYMLSRRNKNISDSQQTEQQGTSEQPKTSFGDLQDQLEEGYDQNSLGKTVGEFRRENLDKEQRRVFDQIRTRIQTTCN